MSIVHGSRASVKYGSSSRHEFSTPDQQRAQEIRESLSALRSCVYVIRFGDVVKIGWSANFGARLIRLGVPRDDLERVLLVRPGTRDDERALHKRFHGSLAKGREYFHPTADVLDWVNEQRDSMHLPPVAA